MYENKSFSVQRHYSQDPVVYSQVEFLTDTPFKVVLTIFHYLILLSFKYNDLFMFLISIHLIVKFTYNLKAKQNTSASQNWTALQDFY